MANEMSWRNWGQDLPVADYGPDNAITAMIGVPRSPACLHFISAPTGNYMCKYGVRTHYECDTADALRCSFWCANTSATDTITLAVQTPTPAWDETYDDTNKQQAYPDDGDSFLEDWPSSLVLPCSIFEVSYWAEAAHAIIGGVINGIEVSAQWDESDDGSDVPLWDWADAAISDAQMPASSVLMTQAIAKSYNHVVYGAVWAIQAAMPGTTDRS